LDAWFSCFKYRMVESAGLVFQFNQTDWSWVNLIIMMGKKCFFFVLNHSFELDKQLDCLFGFGFVCLFLN